MGRQFSVDPVDGAGVYVRDLEKDGALGFLTPPRIEKSLEAACLSRESNKKTAPCGTVQTPAGDWFLIASGRQDSNLRHLAPKASALPNCATPRRKQRLAVSVQLFSQVDAAADRSLRSAEARPCDPVATEPNGAGGAPLQFLWQGVVEGP